MTEGFTRVRSHFVKVHFKCNRPKQHRLKLTATMLASNLWTVLLVFSMAVVKGQPEPTWFKRISATFDGVNLQKCSKKSKAPKNNANCSKKPKTCYFGNQDCLGVGPHPETKCVCSAKTWKCETETCPAFTQPDLPPNGCTADGVADLSSNDPLCPVNGPLDGGDSSAGCVPALYGKSCAYGSEKWYAHHSGLFVWWCLSRRPSLTFSSITNFHPELVVSLDSKAVANVIRTMSPCVTQVGCGFRITRMHASFRHANAYLLPVLKERLALKPPATFSSSTLE